MHYVLYIFNKKCVMHCFPFSVCDDPSSIDNGLLYADGRRAEFQCKVDYSLSGSSGFGCNNDGTGWTDQVPECSM